MKKKLLFLFSMVYILSNGVFATCTSTPKYMDGTVSLYKTGDFWINKDFNKHKVDVQIDNIIDSNSYYDSTKEKIVEPTVELNSCKTSKCYEYSHTGDITLHELYYGVNNKIYITDKNIKDYQTTFWEDDIKKSLNWFLLEDDKSQADSFCKMKWFVKAVDYKSNYKTWSAAKEKTYKNPTKWWVDICYKNTNTEYNNNTGYILNAKQYCIDKWYEDAKDISGDYIDWLTDYTCSYYSWVDQKWYTNEMKATENKITELTCFSKEHYTYSAKITDNSTIQETWKNCTDSKCIDQITCVKDYDSNTKTYLNWKDYVLSNYSNVLKQINPDMYVSFTWIDENILNYNTWELSFNFSNICKWYRCNNFSNISVWYDYNWALTLFRPSNTTWIRLKIDKDNTSFDSYQVTSLNTLDVTWSLDIQLPYSWCSNVKYTYRLYYIYKRLDWTISPVNIVTADAFTLNTKDWTLSKEDIDEWKDKFIKVKFDDVYKVAKVMIHEGAYLSKAWDYTFYLYVKDEFWHETALKLNRIPIKVVPWLPSSSTSKAVLTRYNASTSYYTDDTFDIKFILEDSMWNIISNQSWIDIYYDWWQNINNNMQFHLWNGVWQSGYIKWVKSIGYENNTYFPVKIRFKNIWNYPLNFKIRYPKKDWTYMDLYVKIKDWENSEIIPIRPKSSSSDFDIKCTNSKIVLSYNCIYDNFSWCWKNWQAIFTSESDNGKGWSIVIKDHAYNQKTKVYKINHIDKTAPTIWFENYKPVILATNNPLTIDLHDYNRPSGCSINKHLKVLVNWIIKENKTIDYDGSFNILAWIFKIEWVYNIEIQVTDAAWNTTTVNKTIKVIPNNNIHVEFDHTEPNSTVYSDWKTEITSYFIIKDEFWNLLSWYDLVKSLVIHSNSVLDEKNNNEEAFSLIDYSKDISNWKIWIKYALYNNSDNDLVLTWNINAYDRKWINASPYYEKLTSYSSPSLNFHVDTLGNIKNIISQSYFSWNQIITLWYDNKLWIKIPTICSSSQTLKNIKLKLNLSYKNKSDWSTINNIKFIGWTWYVDMVNDLLNGGYTLSDNVTCWNDIYLPFTWRFEATNWIPSPRFIVGWNVEVTYNINWVDWDKVITKILNFNNKLDINYWWIDVVWMYSNSAKWLYELMRNVWNTNMSKWWNNMKNKYKNYNNIVRNARKLSRAYFSTNTNLSDIWWIYYYKNTDIQLNWWEINKKSLIFVDGWNVYIKWNIRKENPSSNKTLTIVVISKPDKTKWKVIIKPTVTNIDAIIITEGGIFSYESVTDRVDVVKWNKNDELKNQLAIYWFILSKWNTIWWSIAMNGKYVLPWGKKIPVNSIDYYYAWLYDMNFLRRYHYIINPWQKAEDPTKLGWDSLSGKFGTNPVVIFYDPAISSAYWF